MGNGAGPYPPYTHTHQQGLSAQGEHSWKGYCPSTQLPRGATLPSVHAGLITASGQPGPRGTGNIIIIIITQPP